MTVSQAEALIKFSAEVKTLIQEYLSQQQHRGPMDRCWDVAQMTPEMLIENYELFKALLSSEYKGVIGEQWMSANAEASSHIAMRELMTVPSAGLKIGEIIAIKIPRIEHVDPKTRKCTGDLQPFRVDMLQPDGSVSLALAHGETPTRLLRLEGGVLYR